MKINVKNRTKQLYKMKKLLLLPILCFAAVLSAAGQDSDTSRRGQNRLQAYKIAFLTEKMDLSPAEAQKFWPIYNRYESEMREVRMDSRQHKESEIKIEERILNIRKKYNQEFTNTLSAEKANTFFQAEKEFRNIILKEFRDRKKKGN